MSFLKIQLLNDSTRMLIQLGGSFALTFNVACQIISLKSSYILTKIQRICYKGKHVKLSFYARDCACMIAGRGTSHSEQRSVCEDREAENPVVSYQRELQQKKRLGAADWYLVRKQEIYVSMKAITLCSHAYKEKGRQGKKTRLQAEYCPARQLVFQAALLACLTEKAFTKWLVCAMVEQTSECGFCHSFQPAVCWERKTIIKHTNIMKDPVEAMMSIEAWEWH